MVESGEGIGSAVARQLREERRRQRMSMEQLAERAGVHRTYIGLLERGERQPTVAAAAGIAAALGVRLSDLIRDGENSARSPVVPQPPFAGPSGARARRHHLRLPDRRHFRTDNDLRTTTTLDAEAISDAIAAAYNTLDFIDDQLTGAGLTPLAELVELANLSSMLGNLLAAGLAQASNGRYARNRPHHYPDLLARSEGLPDFEVKTALETNMPKGHLAKAGIYLIFRYVLCGPGGVFTRGKLNRGSVVSVWEVRFGQLDEADFSLSNTAGDSGKTAVVRKRSFEHMELLYYVPELLPFARRSEGYDA